MEVTVDSDDLFDAYDAAKSDEAREQLREIITEAEQPLHTLYPHFSTGFTATEEMVDAEEVIEELEKDFEVGIDEAREILNEQAPRGGVVEAGEPMYGELYVYDPDMSADRFDPPAGWRAFKTDNGCGIGFTRSDDPKTVDELFEYLEDLHGDDNNFHITSLGTEDYSQLYYIGDTENLPDGWVREEWHGDENYVKHAEP